VAADGLEAIRYLATHDPPELILLDLMMPEMDGSELRRRLLARPEWAGIPVVIVSARPDSKQRAQLLHVDDVLVKPMSFEELLHVVQNRAKTLPSRSIDTPPLRPLEMEDSDRHR
jgi:CheY-like chemotaxis protein